MKTSRLILAVSILGLVLVSCEPTEKPQAKFSLVDFENITLGVDSISADSANAKFVAGNSIFTVNAGGVWNGGIVCSSKKDTITTGYINQYSSITGSGAPEGNYISKKYGVVYAPASFTCAKDNFGYFSIKSIMVTNSTYAYRDMQSGSMFSKKFAAGDWFKVIITGSKNTVETGKVEYYLADFRNGKSFLLNKWAVIDLVSLGEVDKVTFTVDSSDKGPFVINTPTYVCIDNIYFTQNYTYPLGLN